MIFKENGNGQNFKMPEPGSYAARCYRVIDLGTQESSYQGEKKQAHKVLLCWELNEDMEDGKPYVVSRSFTVSLHEKSSLRKCLAEWRGRDFTADELKGFDPQNLIGAPCLISLVQNGDYTNVGSVTKLPKGMTVPELKNDKVFFSLSEFNQSVYDSLSDKLKEKIAASPEYKAVKNGGAFDKLPNNDLNDDIAF